MGGAGGGSQDVDGKRRGARYRQETERAKTGTGLERGRDGWGGKRRALEDRLTRNGLGKLLDRAQDAGVAAIVIRACDIGAGERGGPAW